MEALFQQFNSIHPMSDELQRFILKNLKMRKLKKRELLLKKGQTNSIGSFLSSGLLHCYYIEDDKKITSWFLQQNKLAISVQSFFSQKPSYECIEALEPCELWYLTYEELQTAYKTFLELNFIIRVQIEKYYMLKEEHAYQLQRATKTRERFEWFLNNFPDLITRVPMRYVASFLGVSEETLSRIRNQKY
ncbi:Crp/Fnr family transcriptional regulator [Longitalea luteola]|uniref:Crp/Fnr family transcriptional regulator n=1 Tax=Longitalea luteola TaxID=2812563 RepID=UPI001A960A8F|nr:cyclic nucleotide-binding domain-containing protein [Longitalea luteola]